MLTLQRLEELDLRVTLLVNVEELLTNCAASLRVLKVKGETLVRTSIFFQQRVEKNLFFPNLEEVAFDITRATHVDRLFDILETADTPTKHLTSLKTDAGHFEERHIIRLIQHPRISQLKRLHLTNCHIFTDTHGSLLVKHVPKLEEVGVLASQITGVGVKEMVTKLRRLRELDLQDCAQVGADAVEWARTQGVRVKFQMTQHVR